MPYQFHNHEQAIRFGRIDATMFGRMADDVPLIGETIETVSTTGDAEAGPVINGQSATAAMFDAYNALFKHKPDRQTGTPLLADIAERMQRDDRYPDLRRSTVGNDLAAAIGACGLVRYVLDNLPDEVTEAENDRQQAESEARDAAAEYEAQKSADEDGDEIDADELAESRTYAENKRQAADKAARRLAMVLQSHGKQVQQVISAAVAKADGEAQAVHTACTAFGMNDAAVSGGVPVAEKLKLAESIRKHGKRFTDLVDLIGRMQATAANKQASKMHHDAGEIVDLTAGNEIGLLVDDEIAMLRNPRFGLMQRARFMDGDLAQFEVESKETKAKGDIVVLLDESGSMQGQRDAEAKAVTLALAHVALKQRRRLCVHFFQTTITCTVELDGQQGGRDAMAVAMRGLGEIARRGTGGGTSFDAPLRGALETAATMREPDVIVITDGDASLNPTTVQHVTTAKREQGLNVFAMLIGGTQPSAALQQFADRIWCVDSLLDKAAPELFELV